MKKWEVISKKVLFDDWYNVLEEWKIKLSDKKIRDFVINGGPDAVIVFGLTNDNKVLYIEQIFLLQDKKYKTLVAGMIDKGYTPLEIAKKELREEAGCEATEWIDLGTGLKGKWTKGTMYYFLAKGVKKVGEQQLEDSEFIDVGFTDMDTMETWLKNGEIQDIAVEVGAHRAIKYLKS
jgi:ADP-ribose pyrophosphatase